jgi:hypothetical protein
MGLVEKLLATPGRRIRGLVLGGRWKIEMGVDRCGENRGMEGEVVLVDRGWSGEGNQRIVGVYFEWVVREGDISEKW